MEERLAKILARFDIGSRRECEALIIAGVVTLNGQVVTEVGLKVDPLKSAIKVHGKLVQTATHTVSHQYLMVHKPKGILTTLKPDPEGRPTLADLLNQKIMKARLFPVGRLDFNSEGLVLLTNDGELAYRLTHPKFKVNKTYEVKVQGIPPRRIIDILAKGVNLDDGRTKPAKVRLMRTTGTNAWLSITIAEGKKRQIRRMCEKVRYPAVKLRRVKIGPVRLAGMERGQVRMLLPDEIKQLKEAVQLV